MYQDVSRASSIDGCLKGLSMATAGVAAEMQWFKLRLSTISTTFLPNEPHVSEISHARSANHKSRFAKVIPPPPATAILPKTISTKMENEATRLASQKSLKGGLSKAKSWSGRGRHIRTRLAAKLFPSEVLEIDSGESSSENEEHSKDNHGTKLSASSKESARETANVRGKAYTSIRRKTVKNVTKGARECACCFEILSISNTTSCSASSPHSFCFDCAKRNADQGIVKASFNLVCMDVSGCRAAFPEAEIKRFLDKRSYERFDRLRTEHEVRQAGLEDLVYCPFCSFAAVLDKFSIEFECLQCGVKSCRYCRVKSHRPASCKEYKKERNRSSKQIVEEAMSEAMVRKCNKCGLRFVKKEGCNKMTCTCGNKQCFVCSKNIEDYAHFDGKGRCPMYCDADSLLKEDVDKARNEAVEQLRKTKPDLKEEELPQSQQSPTPEQKIDKAPRTQRPLARILPGAMPDWERQTPYPPMWHPWQQQRPRDSPQLDPLPGVPQTQLYLSYPPQPRPGHALDQPHMGVVQGESQPAFRENTPIANRMSLPHPWFPSSGYSQGVTHPNQPISRHSPFLSLPDPPSYSRNSSAPRQRKVQHQRTENPEPIPWQPQPPQLPAPWLGPYGTRVQPKKVSGNSNDFKWN